MKGFSSRFIVVFCSLATVACRQRASTQTQPAPPTQSTPDAAAPAPLADASVELQRDVAVAPREPESAECRVLTRAAEPLGRRAALTSLNVRSSGMFVGVAWTVPPQFSHGGDDLAAVSLGEYVPSNNHSIATLNPQLLDAEEPSNARGLSRSPTNFYRVFTRAGTERGSITTGTDQLSRDDNGNELIECGEFSVQCATTSDVNSDDAVARNIVRGAPFYARTASDAARPFVLGLRTADVAEQPSEQAKFFATRATSAPSDRSRDFWPLAVDAAAVRRARNPASALRDYVPEGLEIVELAGHGYAVAFRYRGRLRLGWLDASLHADGPLYEIATLGGAPGRPRLASLGESVLLVVADREARDGAVARYKLYGTLATFGAQPGAMFRLPTTMDEAQDEFAPAITATRDGRFALLWSYGPLEANTIADRQDIFVRSFDAALHPIGPALRITESTGSDPRAAPIGYLNDIVVVWGDGRGLQRPLTAAIVRCGEATAWDAGAR